MRRVGRVLIALGILALLSGLLFTAYAMTETFGAMSQSQAPRPKELAHDLAIWIGRATIASLCSVFGAVVLLSSGVSLLILAARARGHREEPPPQ